MDSKSQAGIFHKLQSLELGPGHWTDVQDTERSLPARNLQHICSVPASSNDTTSSSGSGNLAKALQRYNSVRAVAEVNQAHHTQDHSQYRYGDTAAFCQTLPGEFTSAEVGVLGANVSQLHSAPKFWFTPRGGPDGLDKLPESSSAAHAEQPRKLPAKQIPSQPGKSPLAAEWDSGVAQSLQQAAQQHASFALPGYMESNCYRIHTLSQPTDEADFLPGFQTRSRECEEVAFAETPRPCEDADLEETLARIELANETELLSSHAYVSHRTWPVATASPHHDASAHLSSGQSFGEDFSPLQSSTLQLQAHYWPKGFAQFRSYKCAQRSPHATHARAATWSAPAAQSHLRDSATSTDAMLGPDREKDQLSKAEKEKKTLGLWSRLCGCAKKQQQLSPLKPKPSVTSIPPVFRDRPPSHTSKLLKALRSKKVHVWDLIDAQSTENAVRNFQTFSKVPIIPDDFGPEGPLQEGAGKQGLEESAESETIPAYISERIAEPFQDEGWISSRYASLMDQQPLAETMHGLYRDVCMRSA